MRTHKHKHTQAQALTHMHTHTHTHTQKSIGDPASHQLGRFVYGTIFQVLHFCICRKTSPAKGRADVLPIVFSTHERANANCVLIFFAFAPQCSCKRCCCVSCPACLKSVLHTVLPPTTEPFHHQPPLMLFYNHQLP
jgi:hypothetical protein